jgi:hypothetical protein
MPFCSNCGLQHKEGSKFCTSCGTKIEPNEETRTRVYESPTYYNHLESTEKSLQTLSTFLIILLYIMIARGAIELLWAIFKWKSYVASFEVGNFVSPMSSVLVLIFGSFFFVRYIWIYKVSKIYNEKYDDMEYTPLMAVVWLFIPILNLFMPFLVMKDLCKNNYLAKESCFWWYISYLLECIAFTLCIVTIEESPKTMAKASVFWTFTSIFSCYCFARIVSNICGKDVKKYGK